MNFRGNVFFSGLKMLFFWICFWRCFYCIVLKLGLKRCFLSLCFWFGDFPSFWFSFRQLVRSVDSVGQFRPVCNAFGENAFLGIENARLGLDLWYLVWEWASAWGSILRFLRLSQSVSRSAAQAVRAQHGTLRSRAVVGQTNRLLRPDRRTC